jgi:hypothetical protein
MNRDKYCDKCGTVLIRKEIDGFDTITGKRCTKKVCKTLKCGHYGLSHNFLIGSCKCNNCGYQIPGTEK